MAVHVVHTREMYNKQAPSTHTPSHVTTCSPTAWSQDAATCSCCWVLPQLSLKNHRASDIQHGAAASDSIPELAYTYTHTRTPAPTDTRNSLVSGKAYNSSTQHPHSSTSPGQHLDPTEGLLARPSPHSLTQWSTCHYSVSRNAN